MKVLAAMTHDSPLPGSPRYPDLRVSLHTDNPLAVVSAVRLALRKAGTDRREIDRFTREALGSPDPQHFCDEWVQLDVDLPT